MTSRKECICRFYMNVLIYLSPHECNYYIINLQHFLLFSENKVKNNYVDCPNFWKIVY